MKKRCRLKKNETAAFGKRFAFIAKIVPAVTHLEGEEIQGHCRNRTKIRIQTQILFGKKTFFPIVNFYQKGKTFLGMFFYKFYLLFSSATANEPKFANCPEIFAGVILFKDAISRMTIDAVSSL